MVDLCASTAEAGQRFQGFVQLLDPFLRLIPLHP